MNDLEKLKEQIVSEVMDTMEGYKNQQAIREFIDCDVANLPRYHHTTGRDIRNNYRLWDNKLLQDAGIHPDDFSYECICEIHFRAVQQYRRSLIQLK